MCRANIWRLCHRARPERTRSYSRKQRQQAVFRGPRRRFDAGYACTWHRTTRTVLLATISTRHLGLGMLSRQGLQLREKSRQASRVSAFPTLQAQPAIPLYGATSQEPWHCELGLSNWNLSFALGKNKPRPAGECSILRAERSSCVQLSPAANIWTDMQVMENWTAWPCRGV